ncbi:MAG: hypothetical protein Q7R96_05735 [Nanoarchaeota archaeon]|nr:hypothetical protein [Nanoarchaeota archaeon]
MAQWREKVHPKLKQHLESQIVETAQHKEAYMHAEDPSIAQLWVAIANITRQCYELNVKLANIDNALRESLLQRQAAIEKLLEEKYAELRKAARPVIIKQAVRKPVKRVIKKVVKRKVKGSRKVSRQATRRAQRSTQNAVVAAAVTARRVAEQVTKETIKESAKRSARASAKRSIKKTAAKRRAAKNAKVKDNPLAKKRDYVLLREV